MTDTVYSLALDNTMRINLRRILRDEQSRVRDAIVMDARRTGGDRIAGRRESLVEELDRVESLLYATRALQPIDGLTHQP